ncbi:rho GTPase-activating protein 40 isoform X3 [Lissotriton helveticus]
MCTERRLCASMKSMEYPAAYFVTTRIPRPQILLRPARGHGHAPSTLPHSPRRCPCKMSQTLRRNSLESPSSDCSSSCADPLDTLSMDDFWTEVENINQSSDSDPEDGSSLEPKTPDEGEIEADWFQDAGLSILLTDHTADAENYLLLSTLTKTQAAAVQRRLDTYSRSMRKKSKQPVRDVRDVFGRDACMGLEEPVQPSLDPAHDSLGSDSHPDAIGFTVYPSALKGSGTEEEFCMDVAYSEQAALLKATGQVKSRKLTPEETLPKFEIPKGRLGVTRIGDLSALDMKKIPTLALIELTALCDILDLDLKRNKPVKRKTSEHHLFGVPLSNLLENDQKLIPNTQVPLILQACLQQKLESDFYIDLYGSHFSWDDVHQNDASGLLKKFIREFPTPLLTAEYISAFAAVQNIPDLKQRLQALNLLILLLPECNRNTLKALLEFLRKVVVHEKKNKMNLWNVSTVIAPNLFMHRGMSNKIPEGKEKQLAEGAADVVRLMIHYQDLLWTVSSFLVAQVRKLNENSARRYQFNDRLFKNLLRKINPDKDRTEKTQGEPCKMVKIQASVFLKESLEVHLNNGTRAADVLSLFQKYLCQRSCNLVNMVGLIKWSLSLATYSKISIDSSNLLLYEVGGNISERCLDPDTFLLDLYHINPSGEWIIKQNTPLPPVF